MGLTADNTLRLKVEPGLMEWRGFRCPKLLTEPELIANGFKVDTSYATLVNRGEIAPEETIPEFYERTRRVMDHLMTHDGRWFSDNFLEFQEVLEFLSRLVI